MRSSPTLLLCYTFACPLQVYNMSPYLRFHPGGADILMKAAGKDGTALFLKYHPWVNIDALMEKCLVGFLAEEQGPQQQQQQEEAAAGTSQQQQQDRASGSGAPSAGQEAQQPAAGAAAAAQAGGEPMEVEGVQGSAGSSSQLQQHAAS
jgi:hypothetical protein